MYNNNSGSRTLIAYSFLGEYVNSLDKEELDFSIESIGLNDLLDKVNDIANERKMTVSELVFYLSVAIESYIDEYEKLDYKLSPLSPVLGDIVLVNLHELVNNEISYDVYSMNGGNLDQPTRETINRVIQSIISNDIENSNVIIVFIDIIKYGMPICKLYFNDI
jgi:hypothetical protein